VIDDEQNTGDDFFDGEVVSFLIVIGMLWMCV